MLDSLRFVQGAVARKDFVPVLTHFSIKDGRIKGYNGRLGLCSPIPLELDVHPKATSFIKAVQTCKETAALHITKTGRLAVKSGNFKAYIECIDEEFPELEPEGDYIKLAEPLLPILQKLAPFISEDASRPWSRGILFRGRSAFATNNIVFVEHWLGYDFHTELNIPYAAIRELLRIGLEPVAMQLAPGSVTFHYEGDRWLKASVYDEPWPDISSIFDKTKDPSTFPAELFAALHDLEPFADEVGRVYFYEGRVATSKEAESGASVTVDGIMAQSVFQLKYFLMLEALATKIDFTNYPQPCQFQGEQLRGVILGMRE